MRDPRVPDEVREAIDEERQITEIQSRIDRSWALRLEHVLAERSPGVVVIVGLLVLALIGVIDAASGTLAVEVLYLLPVGVVTFGRGRITGLLVAGVASVTWEAVEVFQGVATLASPVPYWNALGRFGAFAAIVLLIAPMRQAMVLERQLAEREAEAVAQLRALEELREVALVTDDEDRDHVVIAEEPPIAVVEEVPPPEAGPLADDPPSADADDRLLDALSDLERDARRDRSRGR